jgi:predicted transglutaminase-like cysteine proteinase
MLLISLSPLRFRKFLRPVVAGVGFTSICCFAQTMFFAVDTTPYDHQMVRVYPILVPAARYPATWVSLITINQYMGALRAMPYHYSNQWQTPAEVQFAQAADCKGKAVLLYEKMQAMGARNFRLVIGKRRADALQTHAWVEWDTQIGTWLLDPTFNSMATQEMRDGFSYIPFYAYDGAYKYQAANFALSRHNEAAHRLVAPAQGTSSIARSRR